MWSLDPTKCALLVIDMQNAYASPGGYIDLAGFDISGARVLLAEDHPTNQKVVQLVLDSVGIDPVIVENGKADPTERVLEAGTGLLAEKGYEGFTLAEVSRRAGVSIGSLSTAAI